MSWGLHNRLSRIIRPADGHTVMLAADHGYFLGPTHKLEIPRKTLEPLLPYADAVMVTSVYVPGLGGGSTPAMFSAPVVAKLRTQLGFEGAIVTDSLSMGGIGARWPLPEAAVMALAAGNDMLLLGNGDPNYEADAVSAVRGAVLSGRLDRTKLHESAMRVNALRDRWGGRYTPCRPALIA